MKYTQSVTIEDPQKKKRNKKSSNQDEIPQKLKRGKFHGTCREVIITQGQWMHSIN
jgi:hypothetical protein